ncbi:hypothetical protein ACRRTK_020720 [Alexandromys fortis]
MEKSITVTGVIRLVMLEVRFNLFFLCTIFVMLSFCGEKGWTLPSLELTEICLPTLSHDAEI